MFCQKRVDRMKCRAIVGLLGAAVSLLMVNSASAEETKTIGFWKAPHSADEAALWAPYIAEFEKAHPGVKIDHVITPWNTWNEAYTAAFASGKPPCVSYMVDAFSPAFIYNKKFVDLNAAGWSDQVKDGYGPLWTVANFGGMQVGVPFATGPRMWLYNKDMFDKAGVKYPAADWTMDDLVETLRKLKAGGVETPGNIPVSAAKLGYQSYLPFLWSMGGDILDKEGRPRVDDEASIHTMKWLKVLFDEKLIAPIGNYSAQEGQDLFVRGSIAVQNMAAEVLGKLKTEAPDLKYGIVKSPTGPGGQYNFQDWGYFAIAGECAYKDEAWEFVKFITSKKVVEQYIAAVGLFPARVDTNLYQSDPDGKAFLDNMAQNRNIPIVPKSNQIVDLWFKEVEAALSGIITPEEAAKNAQGSLERVLR